MEFPPPVECYNFHKGDYETMRTKLDGFDWDSLPGFNETTGKDRVERMKDSLANTIDNLVELYVPKVKRGGKPKKKAPLQ